MKTIHVVAAVIYCPKRNNILIAKRPHHLHQGGLWEFPGGKLEGKEAPVEALKRELFEELNIKMTSARQFTVVSHDYPDKSVLLDVWEVLAFVGEPRGIEGQEVRWVERSTLTEYDFPDANVPILNKVLHNS